MQGHSERSPAESQIFETFFIASFEREGFLRYLFPSGSSDLVHLRLEGVVLKASDIEFIAKLRSPLLFRFD